MSKTAVLPPKPPAPAPETKLLTFALNETSKGVWQALVFKLQGNADAPETMRVVGLKVVSADAYRRQPEADLWDAMNGYYIGGIAPEDR